MTRNAGDAIDDYSWRARGGSPSSGSSSTYSPSFRTSVRKTVSLTVSNSADSDSDDYTVTVINRRPERVGSISALTFGAGWSPTSISARTSAIQTVTV